MILDDILARKVRQLAEEKQQYPMTAMQEAAEQCQRTVLDFPGALAQEGVQIIAEVKRASPSKGLICQDFQPTQIAREYAAAGAAAVSVLTEKHFFQGDDAYLQGIREQVALPLLRKDFILDGYQVYQARVIGADAILLIAAALDDKQLDTLLELADSLGLHCLVEVHNELELQRVLNFDVKVIGINNRNLHTFEVSLQHTAALRPLIPDGIRLVSESGIHSRDDMIQLAEWGVDAVLVGESLMRAPSIAEKIQELRGGDHDRG